MASIPFAKLRISETHRGKVGPDAPRKIRLAVAKGALPMPIQEQVGLAFALLKDSDRAIAEVAHATLQSIPTEKLIAAAVDQASYPPLLEYFAATRGEDQELSRVIYRVRGATDRTAMLIAQKAQKLLAEDISRNQERLLITPEVYLALKRNPVCSTQELERVASFLRMNRCLPAEEADAPASRGAAPIDAEDLRKRQLQAEVEAAILGLPSPTTNPEVRKQAGLEMFNLDDLDNLKSGDGDEDLSGFSLNFESDDIFSFDLTRELDDMSHSQVEEARISIAKKLQEMKIGEKIKLAYKGNAEVRRILVKDRNKMVACAVVKSGRMSERELLSTAMNRNVERDVIREVTRIKEAMRRLQIRNALANNPKCPVPVAVSIVKSMGHKDVEKLSRNKNVSGPVQQLATRKLREFKRINSSGKG